MAGIAGIQRAALDTDKGVFRSTGRNETAVDSVVSTSNNLPTPKNENKDHAIARAPW